MHYPIIEDLNEVWLCSMQCKLYKIDSYKIKIRYYRNSQRETTVLFNKGALITEKFAETINLHLSDVEQIIFYDFVIVDKTTGKKVSLKTNKFIKIKLLGYETLPCSTRLESNE